MAKTFLVIEDDADLQAIMKAALEADGYRVLQALDGEDGLEAVRKKRPDAVILDIMIPKKNGLEIAATMQQDEKLRDIPIMVVTGVTEGTRASEAEWRERMQVADFLVKPFDAEQLAGRARRLVGEAQESEA